MAQSIFPRRYENGTIEAWLIPLATEGLTQDERNTLIAAFTAKLNDANPADKITFDILFDGVTVANYGRVGSREYFKMDSSPLYELLIKINNNFIQKDKFGKFQHIEDLISDDPDLLWTYRRILRTENDLANAIILATSSLEQARAHGVNIRTWQEFLRNYPETPTTFPVVPIPNKFKEKYLKYKQKYLDLKKLILL